MMAQRRPAGHAGGGPRRLPSRAVSIIHARGQTQGLRDLCRRGRALGCTDLQLSCDSRNTSALAFYEAQGMQRKLIQFRKKL